MRRKIVEELVTLDAGDYWLGDPCYVIWDAHWIPWLEATDYRNQTNLIGVIPGTDHEAVGFSTSYGDGVYPLTVNGEEVFQLPVDAGMIGFVPVEYGFDPKGPELVTKVSFSRLTAVRWKNGDISWWDSDGKTEVKTNV